MVSQEATLLIVIFSYVYVMCCNPKHIFRFFVFYCNCSIVKIREMTDLLLELTFVPIISLFFNER